MELNFSKHLQNDHPERLAALDEYIGFTNIVLEVVEIHKKYGRRRVGITSSGIMVIRSLREDFIITAYLPTMMEIEKVAKQSGKKCVPPKLLKKVQKNLERHPELMFMVG